MTKYTSAAHRRVAPRPQGPHPIWRGIGCLMILIVPLMSYLLAVITVQIAIDQKWPMPYQLMGYPSMPPELWAVSSLAPLWAFIEGQKDLYAVLGITLVYVVFLGAFLSFGYALIYRFVGPPRYGPLDAPPPRVSVKRYKR